MATPPKIHIPLNQRWKWLRYQWAPIVLFGFAVALTMRLWSSHIGASVSIGEVYGKRWDMGSKIAGKLAGPSLEPFQRVKSGDVVIVLEAEEREQAIEVLRAEMKQLASQLEQIREKTRIDERNEQFTQLNLARNYSVWIEQRRLTQLQLKTQLEADKRLFEQYAATYSIIKRNFDKGNSTAMEEIQYRMQRELVKARITQTVAAIKEAARQINAAEERQKLLPQVVDIDVEKLLQPIREQINVEAEKIKQIEAGIDEMTVRAPADGTITAIFKRPGQAVVAGEPVLTIASNEAEYVVSYVRQGRNTVQPLPAAKVNLRLRRLPVTTEDSKVVEVGPHVELIPQHQLRDPKILEWGVPVKIHLPDNLRHRVRPGELLDVQFRHDPSSASTTADIAPDDQVARRMGPGT